MRVCPDIDLRRSLATVFANRAGAESQIERDAQRQSRTAEEITRRFFAEGPDRREMVLLADEVGLGKTFVALTVAASILDAIRRSEAPPELPGQKPAVLVLTPNNTALYNKWRREVETFRRDCSRKEGALDWIITNSPIDDSDKSGNVINLAAGLRQATKSRPVLMVAKLGVLGSQLHAKYDWWRRRALAAVFQEFGINTERRARLCRQVLGTGSQANVPELLDLRRAGELWSDTREWSADLRAAYELAIREGNVASGLHDAIRDDDADRLRLRLDDLTRLSLMRDLPRFALVIIDEIHNLKNEATAARQSVELLLRGKATRLLGLSATPFQLHHDELLRVLGLRKVLGLPRERHEAMDAAVEDLASSIQTAQRFGERFRETWQGLRPDDNGPVQEAWAAVEARPRDEWKQVAEVARPSRIARALANAVELERANRRLEGRLRPFVIRHRHERGYREHFVGRDVLRQDGRGSRYFEWAPGMEVNREAELAHYLLMRAVALAKSEKGRAGLGAELTGSYRHLVETSATWKRLASGRDPRLASYQRVLDSLIVGDAADRTHPKIRATVERALRAFEAGQKVLIFCVYVKTAEALRDEMERRLSEALAVRRDRVFGDEGRFEAFRRRFFNRREPLFALVQDHPLLGRLPDGGTGIPAELRLGADDLSEIATLLVDEGETADVEKPDRRLLLAAVEHVSVLKWEEIPGGRAWLDRVLGQCPELREAIGRRAWVPRRALLAASPRAKDPEAGARALDPLRDEDMEEDPGRPQRARSTQAAPWINRLRAGIERRDSVVQVVAPYFAEADSRLPTASLLLPLPAQHHADLLAQLDVDTRRAAGQVFRRILMAEEYLIRYLADAPREREELWIEYLRRHYTDPLQGHNESLRDRVHAYIETLVRAQSHRRLLEGYREAATNLNIVQLVKGGMDRDRYFLGFNTPYRPEILISTSVGQEGIDLHRECRHVIHHDLCWNPAAIEQRTGRVDRIGSKVERERAEAVDAAGPALDIAVPYLAATYDERMFEELYRRAQMFEVTMGGDFRVDGRVEPGSEEREKAWRQKAGIGTTDEDLGSEGDGVTVDLPSAMVERLRVNLAVERS